ncbi:SprT family zinc-dependent metalloprotease [Vineibacter terrae]|uniref:SprT family zinc-dependent metalloprotease n=1 Tax=Vineibacter terrae TaxID=2586908 RepID=A0A5C8PAQ3_9HYPH|nr:SprT-like domain-containing protein [Vineibacter terrae]TXL70851.1 SprT family zinc-dependent metalloprotease [Vineibacter terrae]
MDIKALHSAWHHWNALFFNGELPGSPRFAFENMREGTLAFYRVSTKEIVLYRGFLSNFLSGPLVSELACHIILHEMCHAWVYQVGGGDGVAHGEKFRLVANRVGSKLGVPECRAEDLWCWPDHPDEGLRPYLGCRISHGEELQAELLRKEGGLRASAKWSV